MIRFRLFWRVASLALLVSASGIQGAELNAKRSDLSQWEGPTAPVVRELGGVALPDIEPFRAELDSAIHDLRAALAHLEPEVEAAWLRYLQLDELERGLASNRADKIAALQALRRRLRTEVEGLETDEVVRLRSAAHLYERQLRLHAGNASVLIRGATATVRSALASAEQPNQVEAEQVGRAIGLLEDAGYAPDLVAAARTRWNYPNVVVRVGTGFLGKFVERDIAEYAMQSATILGTATRGPASIQGRLELESIPNDEVAQLQLRMTGASRSNSNVGRNGPAIIYSSSSSQFNGGKSLYFDPVWGLSTTPARMRVNSTISIKRIDIHSPRLPDMLEPAFTRAAWNKAQQNHAAAESEVERLTSRRLEQRIEQEIAEPLRQAQETFHEALFLRLLRIDHVLQIASRSTADFLEVSVRNANQAQLNAVRPAPEFESPTQVGLAIHQSFFSNNSCRLLHIGSEQSDEFIESRAQFIAMQVPPALRVYSNSIPWSATLNLESPTTFIFDDGKIDLTIALDAWTINGRRFARPVNLHVVYGIENSRLGMTFTRVGELKIAPADGRPWTDEEQSVLVPHMTEKLSALFQESGRFNSLILPKGDGFGPFGSITLTQLHCDDGWLLIGYQ